MNIIFMDLHTLQHLFTKSQTQEKDVLDVMQIFDRNKKTSFDEALDEVIRLFNARVGNSGSLKLSKFINACKADSLNDIACKLRNCGLHFFYNCSLKKMPALIFSEAGETY